MTVPEILAKTEQFKLLISQFNAENPMTREIKAMQREINDHFRYATFKDDEEKAATRQEFEKLIMLFKERQEELNLAYEKFAADTEGQVRAIKESLGEETTEKTYTKEEFAQIKKQVNEVIGRFRQNQFPSRERKDQAWAMFSACRNQLKKEEDRYYESLRGEKEKQSERSAELAGMLIPAIECCHPEVTELNMAEGIDKFKTALTSTGLSTDIVAANEPAPTDEKKTRNPLLAKSEALRSLRKFLNENRELITREDRSNIQFVVEEVQTDLDKAWSVYKETLQKKRDEWEEKKKVNDEKRKEWEVKQKEYLARLEDRLANQSAFKTKLEAIYQKQFSFLEKLEKRLVDQLAFIGKLNVHLEGLEEKQESARSDQFRETVTEWINDKKSKIADVEDDVADLEDKLKDVKTRTEELSDKIRDIELSKVEISQKIDEVQKKLGRVKPANKSLAG